MSPLRLRLLGDPVSHSRSPAMHTAALAACGIDGSYEAVRVDAAGMVVQRSTLVAGSLDGANITMPHKNEAWRLADLVAPDADRARSVNTWRRSSRGVEGHSTDITAVRRLWADVGSPGAPVVVFGAGGVARAMAVAFAPSPVMVAARRPGAAAAIARSLGVEVATWGESVSATVVNCTPLGMGGEPLPVWLMDRATGLVDLAYGREATPAVIQATDAGLPVVDGLAVLAGQAEDSFELWTGLRPPTGLMESVARKLSSD